MKHQLDFEKPIAELQRKLEELTKHREAHGLGVNFDEDISRIEKKIAGCSWRATPSAHSLSIT